jgi:hypothetical protein
MTVRELLEQYERQLVLRALADEPHSAKSEIDHLLREFEHLRGTPFRLSKEYLPASWVMRLDPTQVDGRVTLKGIAREDVGIGSNVGSRSWRSPQLQFQIHGGPSFTLGAERLLNALRDGEATEAE